MEKMCLILVEPEDEMRHRRNLEQQHRHLFAKFFVWKFIWEKKREKHGERGWEEALHWNLLDLLVFSFTLRMLICVCLSLSSIRIHLLPPFPARDEEEEEKPKKMRARKQTRVSGYSSIKTKSHITLKKQRNFQEIFRCAVLVVYLGKYPPPQKYGHVLG